MYRSRRRKGRSRSGSYRRFLYIIQQCPTQNGRLTQASSPSQQPKCKEPGEKVRAPVACSWPARGRASTCRSQQPLVSSLPACLPVSAFWQTPRPMIGTSSGCATGDAAGHAPHLAPTEASRAAPQRASTIQAPVCRRRRTEAGLVGVGWWRGAGGGGWGAAERPAVV